MRTKLTPLPIGSTIGILGGGQLGRMLSLAASKLGMKTHIFCPDKHSPAFDVCQLHTIAAYENKEALEKFAKSVDVVTYEFENVPAETAAHITRFAPLAPAENALRISQDRLLEKKFLAEHNIEICPFAPVSSLKELDAAIKNIGTPAVLKTTRFGYDGKGQRIIHTDDEAKNAYSDLSDQALVLEAFVPFSIEISAIVARNSSSETAAFAPAENVHKNHILHTSTVPANIHPDTARSAIAIADKIAAALSYQGILAVEFFVLNKAGQQSLLVNEIAPRVHNSGHWTQNGCPSDQFEQHIRAICNWPLGKTQRFANVIMTNLIGDEIHNIPAILGPHDTPHIYGKHQSRPGRKMGHINQVRPFVE